MKKLIIKMLFIACMLFFYANVNATGIVQQSRDSVNNCVEDSFENNDSENTATVLQLNIQYGGLQSCEYDDDLFTFSASEPTEFKVEITHSEDSYPFVEVYSPSSYVSTNNSTVSDGVSTKSYIQFLHTQNITQQYFIKVDGSVSDGYAYDIKISAIKLDICNDDSYEENDSDTSPKSIMVGTPVSGMSCFADRDFYVVDIPADSSVQIDLTFKHAESDLVLEIQEEDGSGFNFARTSQTPDDNEQLFFTNSSEPSKRILLQVYGANRIEDLSSATYELLVTVLPDCVDDTFVNDYANPLAIDFDTSYSGVICYGDNKFLRGDSDSFEIAIDAGDTVRVDLLFTQSGDIGNLDLSATYEVNSIPISSYGFSDTSDERVEFTSPVATTVRLTVLGREFNDTNSYQIVVTKISECVDDSFENNNYIDQAVENNSSISVGQTVNNLMLCFKNKDVYSIEFTGGKRVTVELKFDHFKENIADTSNLNLAVYYVTSWGDEVWIRSNSLNDNEILDFIPGIPGVYYIVVDSVSDEYGYLGASGSYALSAKESTILTEVFIPIVVR